MRVLPCGLDDVNWLGRRETRARLLRVAAQAVHTQPRHKGMGIRRVARTTTSNQRTTAEGDLAEVVREWWANRQPARSAQEILCAAIELFGEQGYHATTTRDIVTRVGMSTGALYAHFSSKEELLFEICYVGHGTAVASLREAVDASDDPVEQLSAMVRSFTVWHARFQGVARVVHFELYSLSPAHLEQVLELRRQTRHLTVDVLERGRKNGHFQPPDVAGSARAILSLCIDVARWYRPDKSSTPEEVGNLYADLALRMVTGDGPVSC